MNDFSSRMIKKFTALVVINFLILIYLIACNYDISAPIVALKQLINNDKKLKVDIATQKFPDAIIIGSNKCGTYFLEIEILI